MGEGRGVAGRVERGDVRLFTFPAPDKPRPVLLAVTCQIIDFDPVKVKKFEAKSAN